MPAFRKLIGPIQIKLNIFSPEKTISFHLFLTETYFWQTARYKVYNALLNVVNARS